MQLSTAVSILLVTITLIIFLLIIERKERKIFLHRQVIPMAVIYCHFAWLAPLYYTQGGFNGTTTLSDFYDKFESTDKRREAVYDYPSSPPNPGRRVNVGFLIGPQYNLFTDDPLTEEPSSHLYSRSKKY